VEIKVGVEVCGVVCAVHEYCEVTKEVGALEVMVKED